MELKRIIFDVGEGEKELYFSDGNVPYDAEKAQFLYKLMRFVFLNEAQAINYAEMYFTVNNEPYCAARKEGAEGYRFLACEKKDKLVKLAEGVAIINKLTELIGFSFIRAINAFMIDKEGFSEFLKNPGAAFEVLKFDDNLSALQKTADKKVSSEKVTKAEFRAKTASKEFSDAEKAHEKMIASHNADISKRALEIEEIDKRINQIENDQKIKKAIEAVRLLDLESSLKRNEEELPRLESRLKYANRAYSRAQEYEIKINKVYRYIELEPLRQEILAKRRPDAEKLDELNERHRMLTAPLSESETRTNTKITMVKKTVFVERVDYEKQNYIDNEIEKLNREIEDSRRAESKLRFDGESLKVDSPDVVALLKRFYSLGLSPIDAREAAYKKLNRPTPREEERRIDGELAAVRMLRDNNLKKIEDLRCEYENCKVTEENIVEEPFYTQTTETVSSISAEDRAKIAPEISVLEKELTIYSQRVAKFDAEIAALDLDDLISGDKLELYNLPRHELARLKEDNDNNLKENMRRKRKTAKEIRETSAAIEELQKEIAKNQKDLKNIDRKKEEEYRKSIAEAGSEIEMLNERRERLSVSDETDFQDALEKSAQRIAKLGAERDKAVNDAKIFKEMREDSMDAGTKIKTFGYDEILKKTERADRILRLLTNNRYGVMVDDSLYLIDEAENETKPDSLSETDKLYVYVALLSVDNPFEFFVLDDSVTNDAAVKENIVSHAKCALPVFRNI